MVHRLAMLAAAVVLLAGCSSTATRTSTPTPTETVTQVAELTPTPTPTASPTATPTPSPTPPPARKSVVNAPHPNATLKDAMAALDAMATSDDYASAIVHATPYVNVLTYSPPYSGCRDMLTHPHAYDDLSACGNIAGQLYLDYIKAGDEKYFKAALAFFDYVWNWQNVMSGVTNEFNQAQTRAQMVTAVTKLCRDNSPEYGDAIP